MNPKATQYANSKVPNPDRNDAPYFTSRDRWQDVYEAYEAGEKGERERLQAQIKLAWEDGWLSRTKACGLSAGEIMAKKFQRWNIFKQTKDI